MCKPIKIGVLGLGRIGMLHSRNVASMPQFQIIAAADPYLNPDMESNAMALGIPMVSKDPQTVFDHPEIEAVLIASATETHSDFIIQAAERNIAAFCEKPIDNNIERIEKALCAVKKSGIKLQIGFVRRFDRHHARLQALVSQGKAGEVNLLKITSRDPSPPTYEYVANSGGIYVDMMIHDFDMARFMVGSEVDEVFAAGTVLCDPLFEKAHDADTAVVTLKFTNGALGVIDNSRRSGFGYDQRIEVLGSKGCLMDQNPSDSNVLYCDNEGIHAEPVQHFFLERYNDAFVNELRQFANSMHDNTPMPVTGFDGLQAVLIAEAADRSAVSGKFEKVRRISI